MIENDRLPRTGGEMANYTLKPLDEIPDVLGDYPGEMRMGSLGLDCEQVAFTWRRMPPQTGGKGSYGHRHKTQEEVYFVASGTLAFKLEDEVMDVPAGTVVRVGPEVARSVWNDGPDDAILIMVSRKVDDPGADVEKVDDFWVE
jgi:mannose-6-phosphate isomerase-like protein (cupin superfamily)